jgi:ubiquinone/menaquinone biosynthesis C-methylase UbiE
LPIDTGYPLSNAEVQAGARMDILSRLYDGTTRRVLDSTGLAPGWRCLEVGGGSGSIARWMAGRVGPTGSVMCTDIDTRLIERSRGIAPPNLEVVKHDIASHDLPPASFDLGHARLVLIHVLERETAMERMVQALKPGGWLVVEDYDPVSVLANAEVNQFETPLPTSGALQRYLTRNQDGFYARRLHGRFRSLGLEEVSAEGRMVMFDRRNGGAELLRLNFEQVGAELIAAGLITQRQLDADLARLTEEDFAIPSPIMWSVIGRKPRRASRPD